MCSGPAAGRRKDSVSIRCRKSETAFGRHRGSPALAATPLTCCCCCLALGLATGAAGILLEQCASPTVMVSAPPAHLHCCRQRGWHERGMADARPLQLPADACWSRLLLLLVAMWLYCRTEREALSAQEQERAALPHRRVQADTATTTQSLQQEYLCALETADAVRRRGYTLDSFSWFPAAAAAAGAHQTHFWVLH